MNKFATQTMFRLSQVSRIVFPIAMLCFATADAADTPASTVLAVPSVPVPTVPAIVLEQPKVEFTSLDGRVQLLASSPSNGGRTDDLTRRVQFEVQPTDLASIDSTGLVKPIRNGTGSITAKLDGYTSSTIPVVIALPEAESPVNFPNQIVPMFTKYGCNGGGCHGKLAGQNGFKLSLLGFEPKEDFEHLVRESRGRRLFPASPDASLLLQKSVGTVPHGGGQRMEIDSHEYRLLRKWISQAMPYGDEKAGRVVSIEVVPPARLLDRSTQQQLTVVATYSDGRKEDVTRTVQYESNNLDMADVTPTGLVSLRDLAGEVSIMARYQGNVSVFRASIPLGTKIDQWPEERNSIDRAVFAKLRSLGIPPSTECNDATFLRRVTLDLAGRLPTLEEIKNSHLETRSQMIDRLLESDDHAYFFAGKWSAILRNRHANEETRFAAYAFHDWLFESFRTNKPISRIASELLTASGNAQTDPAVVWFRQVSNTESRIEDAAQLFLGQRLQCARCHHHPYEKWSQQDYYQMAAFFSKVEKRDSGAPQEPRFVSRVGDPALKHPKSGQPLAPAGLDGKPLALPNTEDPRSEFAQWMTSPENPFFAKSIANRYWKHFFARGLVEPEDDMRITNPPSNPELLDALAKELVSSGYDLKHLMRTICNSSTYQRTADASEDNVRDSTCYSRYYPKRMTAEVLLDSIDDVLGSKTKFDSMPPGTRAVQLPDTSFASYFLTVFGRPDSATSCECERSTESNLAQSLHLMNSQEMHAKLSDTTNRITQWYATAASAPATNAPTADAVANTVTPSELIRESAKGNIEELYLRALGRAPTASEQTAAIGYLMGRVDRLREAYEDLAWSILNSKEFLFNH